MRAGNHSSFIACQDGIPIGDRMTLSVGFTAVTTLDAAGLSGGERVVERADQALYRAKQDGRDRGASWSDF
jgi:GGDEF domain-containing protein